MARIYEPHGENITIVRGTDHVLGRFIQIQDNRYMRSGNDLQGEGYVFEWDEAFGITLNLIRANPSDVLDSKKLIALTNKFCEGMDGDES